jgi:hypothetical protein
MRNEFELRIQTCAVAGWLTLLIFAALVTVQWLMYLCLATTRPAWVLSLWGPDATWAMAQATMLSAIVTIKMCGLGLAFVVCWLTLWARQLRRHGQDVV